MEPPAKKQRKALMSDSSDDSGGESDSPQLNADSNFKINEEFARRFEYNKKREEIQHLESKHGKSLGVEKKGKFADKDDGSEEDSSESETEDDEAEFATEMVDTEISATLDAIRKKDPRVYDSNAVFYTSFDPSNASEAPKKDKPMFLRDYHRDNLLKGGSNGADDDEDAPRTYAQEQEDLKRSVVKEMHAAADDEEGAKSDNDDDGDDGDGFLVRKSKQKGAAAPKVQITEETVAAADKDPQNFLSNFMAARAWIPTERPELHPFESDDEEDERKAEDYEEAYNLRFEDPNKLNEVLVTHSRDTTSKFSVRRDDELSGRRKKREAERVRKEEEKKQREVERARLRKLKIEELEEKVGKVKKAAGISSSDFTAQDWAHFLDEGWDDAKWEEEMGKRFGEKYYAGRDEPGSDEEAETSSKKRSVKKPTWDDDIDITDLIPDFEQEEKVDTDINQGAEEDEEESHKSKKKALHDKKEKQRDAKRDRRRIEQIVDQNLNLETALLPGSSKKNSGTFRYREASPESFGLTGRDILMADDTQLNQFAGLKKLASFRAPEKKKRDHKNLGKKARLRQWRKDTFGDENGPTIPEQLSAPDGNKSTAGATADGEGVAVDIREGGKKKRKRSKKH